LGKRLGLKNISLGVHDLRMLWTTARRHLQWK